MAKMKIYEIARSMQQQDKSIKSGDLVRYLNENGFEVKGANSNIEDAAIAFLMKNFMQKKAAEREQAAAAKAEKMQQKQQSQQKSQQMQQKTQQKLQQNSQQPQQNSQQTQQKTQQTQQLQQKESQAQQLTQSAVGQDAKENIRNTPERGAASAASETKRETAARADAQKKSGDGNRSHGSHDSQGSQGSQNSDRSHDSQGSHGSQNNGRNRDNRGSRDNRNRDNRDNRGQGGQGRDARGQGRDNRDNRDNRGQGQGGGNRNDGGRNNRNNRGRGGDRVFERFEKSQSGFDGIKQEQKNSRSNRNNRKKEDKNAKQGGYRKSSKEEMNRIRSKKDPNRKGAFIKPEPVKHEPEEDIKQITIPESLTIRELAEKMKMPAAALVKKLFLQGQMVSLNQEISFEEAEEIALSFDIIAELEEKVDMVAELLKEEEEDESKMKKRPPVVCVMGHVDHGKTSLLDAIRQTDVTEHEAGGITQHIGAYVVRINGEKITFLDTPGHEAFTSMRMRGAQSTDIAVLVVAADDGVMPQTVEAINHAKAAGVEIIVAINKIDKEGANIDRVKQELSEYELIPEEWGGSTVFCPVSAHTKEGIENLLEMIVLTADVLELKANDKRRARGIVIEARLDKGRGPVATVLVQKGTLNIGDHIAIGTAYGKVRAMLDHRGERVKLAKPSTPVEILGLNGVPDAGEIFVATDSDKEAKQISQAYVDQGKDKLLEETKAKKLSLDGLFSQIQAGNVKDLNLIIKADVQGSVEAVKQSLLKLSNEEVAVRVIHGGVGAINESDVSLASASNAIIIGFNVRLDNMAKETADRENVDVRLYRVIYDAIEDIEAAMKGMLEPIYEERVIAHAEVRQTFKASGVGTIAGSYVLDGKIERGCRARITREGEQIFEGDLASLKRFKDDVKEVSAGYECGLVFAGFNDIQEEDQIECYKMVEVPR